MTLGENRVRNVASSMAVSPPPTTTRSRPLNSAPSQVAQADTPYFWNFSSDGMPSHLADAPVAMISVSARQLALGGHDAERAIAQLHRGDVGGDHVGPEALGLRLEQLHQLRALRSPLGKPG